MVWIITLKFLCTSKLNIIKKLDTSIEDWNYQKLDEEIFSVNENINYLNSVKELVQLEHDYLSSPERLLKFNDLYFDNELVSSKRKNIKVINNINQIELKTLDQNEQ